MPPRPRPPQRDTPLTVKKHAIDVSIVDGAAVTNIDQVFVNPYPHTVEGTYIFPLADDVALSRFTMFINGQEVEGKLLSVEEARRTYESIVARMRDPALLEYLGTRMFRARIFPIEPKGEARVRLSYTQMLKADDGLVRYEYPLAMKRHSGSPIGSLSIVVNIAGSVPIKSVFSSSHSVAVNRSSEHKASASLEQSNVLPDKDFELFYALSDKEFGLTVLTFRESGSDGFFLARISPPALTTDKDVLPKDISFVLDTSGSMAGLKMDQAKAAMNFCLSNLNERDRFNIIPFSHEALRFKDGLVLATKENIEAARAFVDKLKAQGGTNINDALVTAFDATPSADEGRPFLTVFLTDGIPTVGETATQTILSNVLAKNGAKSRLFVFGVGYDVNTKLLDLLAEQNRGSRDYVEPGEDLELKLSSFYRKVSDPVLADLTLAFRGLDVYDMFPGKLADLFSGTELVVMGRYKGEGHKAVELNGKRRGRAERFVYEANFPSIATDHAFLPRLWAVRKVGFLLDEMRLHGENQELKDTVVQLATKYGIVTPYTAYLVTEPGSVAMRAGGRGGARLFDDVRVATEAAAPGAMARGGARRGRTHAVGANGGAVRESKAARQLQVADSEEALDAIGGRADGEGRAKKQKLVQRVATRTFYFIDDRWVDEAHAKDAATQKVEVFSDAYFKLLRTHPELAKCFALGERVVVVVAGVTYETVPAEAE